MSQSQDTQHLYDSLLSSLAKALANLQSLHNESPGMLKPHQRHDKLLKVFLCNLKNINLSIYINLKNIFKKSVLFSFYLINPTLSFDLMTFTLPQEIKCSSNLLKYGYVEPSSTRITSLQNQYFNLLHSGHTNYLEIPYLRSLS